MLINYNNIMKGIINITTQSLNYAAIRINIIRIIIVITNKVCLILVSLCYKLIIIKVFIGFNLIVKH